MAETLTGTVKNVVTGDEAQKSYIIRFTLEGTEGCFFVWDDKDKDMGAIVPGNTVRVEHDGGKFPKVIKVGEVALEKEEVLEEALKDPDSKIEKTMRRVEAGDDMAYRIARSVVIKAFAEKMLPVELMEGLGTDSFYKEADNLATYIVTGKHPDLPKAKGAT